MTEPSSAPAAGTPIPRCTIRYMTPTAPDAPSTSAARNLRGRALCRLRAGLTDAAALVSAVPRLAPIHPLRWLEATANTSLPRAVLKLCRRRNAPPRLRSEPAAAPHRRCPYPRQPAICLRRQPDKSIRPLAERTGIRHKFFAALYLIALFAATGRQTQAADSLSEAQIKAAYLYNFAKFVEWPDTAAPASTDINLCVIGNNVLDGALQALDGRKAGERSLKVTPHSPADTSLAECHLLYVGVSEQQRMVPILKNLGNAPVLTLSDIADFAEKGGGIALLFRDNKVVFEVNLESIRNAGLRLPGQLLNIATHVYGR